MTSTRNSWEGAFLGSSSVLHRWRDMMLPAVEDPQHLRQCEWDQKLGKIECVFSLYDKMRWNWDDLYVLWGVPNTYIPSLCPPPLPLNLCTPAVAAKRCTWRPWPSGFGDPLGDWDRVNSEMHLEAAIERDWRCIWRPGSRELRDALGAWDRASGDAIGDRDRVNSEMHLEAVIEQLWRCPWGPWSSEFGDALGGHDRPNLEAVIERV